MISTVSDKANVKGGEAYSLATEVNATRAKAAGKEKRDSNIPLQVWQERAGKSMNILQERVKFRVDPANGEVVMETASTESDASAAVTHPYRGAKGSLINRQG